MVGGEAIFSVGILLSVGMIAAIFAYLFINLGQR